MAGIGPVIYNSADTSFWGNMVKDLNENGIETFKDPGVSGSYMRKVEKSILGGEIFPKLSIVPMFGNCILESVLCVRLTIFSRSFLKILQSSSCFSFCLSF